MRKPLAWLLTAILLMGLFPAALAEEALSEDIVILYTNDTHTYIDGPLSFDVLAGIRAELETQYAHVLLADAGDHAQGTAYGSMDSAQSIIALMNAAGYDVATLGNHEFDYGMAGCQNLMSWAQFPYISCNFYHEDNYVRNENVLDSYVLFDCGDMQLAFVGITTPETFSSSSPSYFQDAEGHYIYGISGGEDGAALYQDVQTAVDQARHAGADIVIALGHLGEAYNYTPWGSPSVIENVSGLDAFIDGHSHSTIEGELHTDKDGQSVLLTQTGEYFKNIGMMVIDSETGEIVTDLISAAPITETAQDEEGNEVENIVGYELESELYTGSVWPVDVQTEQIKTRWLTEVDSQLDIKIGSTELVFDNYDAEGRRLVRQMETNSGSFAADALYWLFDDMGMDVDVAVMNGGGVRNTAITGNITYKTCKKIHTFGNVACLIEVPGQTLLDALEWGARLVGVDDEGAFLQVSGLRYHIDTTLPSSVVTDDKDLWLSGPTGGYRVHDVTIYNKETDTWEPLDLNATYRLAGYNFMLREPGDGYTMFPACDVVVDYVLEDYMVLANYVQAFENGVVAADNSPLLAKYPGLAINYAEITPADRISAG